MLFGDTRSTLQQKHVTSVAFIFTPILLDAFKRLYLFFCNLKDTMALTPGCGAREPIQRGGGGDTLCMGGPPSEIAVRLTTLGRFVYEGVSPSVFVKVQTP